MYYAHIKDNKLTDISQCKYIGEEWINLEVSQDIFDNSEKYIYSNGEIILNPDYEAEQVEKERQRLNLLNLTKADVLLALYQDKGITPEDIKTMLKDNTAALIKFDYASSYYRGDEVVNSLGLALGYTSEDMDYLFENKAFPPKADVPADTDSDNDGDTDSDIANDDGSEEENPSVVQAENPDSTGDTDTEL